MQNTELKQSKSSTSNKGIGSGNYKRTEYKPKTFSYAGFRILESKRYSKEMEELKEFVKAKAIELGLR